MLPQILLLQEVKRILSVTENIKHRALLTTVYALGLRSVELRVLKITHLDEDRNGVFIQNAKGKRYRVLPFSESLKKVLWGYYKRNRPKTYLLKVGTANMLPKVLEPYSNRPLKG